MTCVALIGAGSVTFTRDLVANILSLSTLAEVRLQLHDLDESRLETARGVVESVARQVGAHPHVTSHLDRRAALQGADFVINTVLVGGAAAAAVDLTVSERFGVRQTVGDTLGIGAIFRALRTLPFVQALTDDMMSVCPGAILLNYTNPMAMIVGYAAATAPKIQTFGLCHSVHHTVAYLCDLLDVPHEEVGWSSAGVNHQAWILELRHGTADLYPRLDDKIRQEPGLLRSLRVDMYRRLGYFPTESSKHNSEYVPWYLRHATEVERLQLPGVSDRLLSNATGVKSFEALRDTVVRGGDVTLPTQAVEYAPQIIESVVSGSMRRIQVNVPNDGLVDNLPPGAPVEVSATVDVSGVHPWHAGKLPTQCAALNRVYLNVVEMVIQAVLSEDPRAIRQAAMLDPNTAASLTVDEIWRLCNQLAESHGELLPLWARSTITA